MAGQRPEWTSLLFRRRQAEHLSDELPPDDQTLDFVSTLIDLADLGASAKLRDSWGSFLSLISSRLLAFSLNS